VPMPKAARIGVWATVSNGLQSALGRVANVALSAMVCRKPRDAKVGVQETARLGARSAIGKVAGHATNVRFSKSLESARIGVQATKMIGPLNALGKAAGHAMHARRAVDCSRLAMAAILPRLQSDWSSCKYEKHIFGVHFCIYSEHLIRFLFYFVQNPKQLYTSCSSLFHREHLSLEPKCVSGNRRVLFACKRSMDIGKAPHVLLQN